MLRWKTARHLDVNVGGQDNTWRDSKRVAPRVKHELDFLERDLATKRKQDNTRYNATVQEAVYLDKAEADYKERADAEMKAEFMDWLQGKSEYNQQSKVYANAAGTLGRKNLLPGQKWDPSGAPIHVDRRGRPLVVGPGQLLNNWNPTWWGNKQLTHLPGVRETLKKHYAEERNNEYYMNLLATFGPHDVQSAWQYFKYWVKGEKSVTRPDFVTGNEQYDNMLNARPFQRSGPLWMADDARAPAPAAPPAPPAPPAPVAPPATSTSSPRALQLNPMVDAPDARTFMTPAPTYNLAAAALPATKGGRGRFYDEDGNILTEHRYDINYELGDESEDDSTDDEYGEGIPDFIEALTSATNDATNDAIEQVVDEEANEVAREASDAVVEEERQRRVAELVAKSRDEAQWRQIEAFDAQTKREQEAARQAQEAAAEIRAAEARARLSADQKRAEREKKKIARAKANAARAVEAIRDEQEYIHQRAMNSQRAGRGGYQRTEAGSSRLDDDDSRSQSRDPSRRKGKDKMP